MQSTSNPEIWDSHGGVRANSAAAGPVAHVSTKMQCGRRALCEVQPAELVMPVQYLHVRQQMCPAASKTVEPVRCPGAHHARLEGMAMV